MTDLSFKDMDTDLEAHTTSKPATVEAQKCTKCLGSGTVRYGYRNIQYFPCTLCKGTGTVTSTRIARVAGAKRATKTRAENLTAKKAAWAEANVAEMAWIKSKCEHGVKFALSMAEALQNYGSLTEGQMKTVQRLIVEDAARLVERAKTQEANKVQVGEGAQAILAALQKAKDAGLKKPGMRTEKITFSLAPATGKNPGCVYVTTTGDKTYIGKIEPTGMFNPARFCTDEMKAIVANVAIDPLAAAVEYGRNTGQCSCCGRMLTDKKSIELGIGPICLAKYF